MPLVFLAWVNFYQFERQYELQRNEIKGHIQRLLSTGQVQISYFLDERRAALTYVSLDDTFEQLSDLKHLAAVFLRLRRAFGGFVDLGLIDQDGIQRAYMGPYNLQGRDYKEQDWYKEVLLQGHLRKRRVPGPPQLPPLRHRGAPRARGREALRAPGHH